MSSPRDEYGPKLCECGCGQPAPLAKRSYASKGHRVGEPVRFVVGHARRRPIMTRVQQGEGCWVWLGKHSTNGYGVHLLPNRKAECAHRAVYKHLVGPIPEGLVLDHLCLNKSCVNPAHLEPVTTLENNRRWADQQYGPPKHGTERKWRRGCRCGLCARYWDRTTA